MTFKNCHPMHRKGLIVDQQGPGLVALSNRIGKRQAMQAAWRETRARTTRSCASFSTNTWREEKRKELRISNMLRSLLIVACVTGAWPGVVAAQDQPPLSPGARIRIGTRTAPVVLVGQYRSATDSTVALEQGSSVMMVRVADILRLERSRGRRLSTMGGIGGVVLGFAAGAAVGCAANRDSYGVFCGGQDDTKVVTSAVLGGLLGGTIGALMFRREQWEVVPPAHYRGR